MAWFNLKDSFFTVQKATPLPTPAGMTAIPSGPILRFHSVTMGTFDPGGSAEIISGSGITGIAIAIKAAKGKLDIDCSNAFESSDICAKIGGVGSLCIVAINFARQGMTPLGYLLTPATWVNGGGIAIGDGKAEDKVNFIFTDAYRNGTSIYNKLA